MKFEDISTEEFKSGKSNPLVSSKPKYTHKTIRIYEQDYEELRRISYEQKTPIVELMQVAISLLNEKYPSKKE